MVLYACRALTWYKFSDRGGTNISGLSLGILWNISCFTVKSSHRENISMYFSG